MVSGARFVIGDTRAETAKLTAEQGPGWADLIVCSPPFLALRSYLPDDDPGKALEIGSEADPAAFLQVLLELTALWGEALAPHGSIAVELGDTFANSGGRGGDGDKKGQHFDGSASAARAAGGDGWPLPKSLCMIPQLYAVALAYGIHPLTGQPSPAGRWRVRNVKAWIRSNPPVGALSDKERPATSYITVATRSANRWFDLDAVRTAPAPANRRTAKGVETVARTGKSAGRDGNWASLPEQAESAGSPPRDWFASVDAVIDRVITERAGKRSANPRAAKGSGRQPRAGKDAQPERGGNWATLDTTDDTNGPVGARGHHIRRALVDAGLIDWPADEAIDLSPGGYSGAHYAVFPVELVNLLIDEMCPRYVCTTCGEPRRRIVKAQRILDGEPISKSTMSGRTTNAGTTVTDGADGFDHNRFATERTTLGWSDCGHDTWRPGIVFDPFVGSGTTLLAATGRGRDSVGIDLDARNAALARERCGMFLEVDQPDYAIDSLAGQRTIHDEL